MAYGNMRSGSVHHHKGRDGVGQGVKPVKPTTSGYQNRTYISPRAQKIVVRQGAEERRQEGAMIPPLSYPDLFIHGEKERHVPDTETGKDLFVTLGLFPPAHDPKVLVKALKVTGAGEGHPLKPMCGVGIVIERKFLTNHTLPLDKRLSSDMKTVIQYLRAYIVAVAGHVPNGKRR